MMRVYKFRMIKIATAMVNAIFVGLGFRFIGSPLWLAIYYVLAAEEFIFGCLLGSMTYEKK